MPLMHRSAAWASGSSLYASALESFTSLTYCSPTLTPSGTPIINDPNTTVTILDGLQSEFVNQT